MHINTHLYKQDDMAKQVVDVVGVLHKVFDPEVIGTAGHELQRIVVKE